MILLFLFLRDEWKKAPRHDLVLVLREKLELLWRRSGYKVMSRKCFEGKLKSLINDYYKARRYKDDREAEVKKREEYIEASNLLFDCAAADVEEEIRKNRLLGEDEKKEDLTFLADQRGERCMFLGRRDQKLDEKVAKQLDREQKMEERRFRELSRSQNQEVQAREDEQLPNQEEGFPTVRDEDYLHIERKPKKKRSDIVHFRGAR